MRIHRDERGQTIMLVALALPILLGFVGIATDVGSLFMDKRQLQTAADAAAIAGALNISTGTWQSAAKAASATNGFTDAQNGVSVVVNNGPAWPSSNYLGQINYIEATVTKTEPTIFLSLFGHPTVTVLARAVATNSAPGNGCVDALGATGTDLSVQGNVTISAPDCSFNIDSDGRDADAITTTGNAAHITASYVGAVQSPLPSQSGHWSPAPRGGMIPTSDPFSQFPQYSCSSAGCTCTSNCTNNPVSPMPLSCTSVSIGHGTTNLSPGCYNGLDIGSNANVVLSAGTYFFNGSVSVAANGSLSGTGVTLIETSSTGSMSMGGTPSMDITAPASDSSIFGGLLYYQVASDTTPISLGGNAGSTIQGIFYAPTATLTLQGTPGSNIYTNFVVKSLVLAGDASFNSYAALPGGAGGLTSIALVE